MRTIGKRWPSGATSGDYTAECSYCGAAFRRSQLRKDAAGRFACDADARGRDEVTLDRGNAAGARSRASGRPMDAKPSAWIPPSGRGLWTSISSCAYWVEGRDATTLDEDDRVISVADRHGGPDFAQPVAGRRYHVVGSPRRLDGYGFDPEYLTRRNRPDISEGAFSLVMRVLPDSSNLDRLDWALDDREPETNTIALFTYLRASDGLHEIFILSNDVESRARFVLGTYSNAAWRTVVWSCDKTNALLYINGALVGSASFAYSPSNLRQEWVGSSIATNQGIGIQAMFRKALTADEVSAIHAYAAGVYA